MRRFLAPAAHVLLAESMVLAVVAPLGYAMGGRRALSWAISGAAVWTLVFAVAALRSKRPAVGWGVAGGLMCGTAWAFGHNIGEDLAVVVVGSYGVLWAALLGGFGGVGAGLIAGAAVEVVADKVFRRISRMGAHAAAICWGGLAAVAFPVQMEIGPPWRVFAWGIVGALVGFIAMPLGWAVGKRLGPIVVFFEELGPYLAEMARPLAAFAAGFLTLTIVCGGLYGTLWRLDPDGSFRNLPQNPTIWDFTEFSLMTATTGSTPIEAASGFARILVCVEVILGTGWLIVVFGALSVHLAPRLERIALRTHGQAAAADSANGSPSREAACGSTPRVG